MGSLGSRPVLPEEVSEETIRRAYMHLRAAAVIFDEVSMTRENMIYTLIGWKDDQPVMEVSDGELCKALAKLLKREREDYE